jgi:hypothetical protein
MFITLFHRLRKELYALGTSAAAVAIPSAVYAQAEAPFTAAPAAIVVTGPRIAAAIVIGTILALAFQLVLANLSVAAGLNVIGPFGAGKKKKATAGESSGIQQNIRTISSLFGIWALITASIALFFASYLASRVSLTGSGVMGAIIGLTVWGLFYLITMALEAGAVSSMVGALGGIVRNSLRATYSAAAGMFRKSPAEETADAASRITGAVRSELFGSREDFQDRLQTFVRQLSPKPPNPETIARGIAELLNDTEIKAVTSNDGQQTVLQFLQKGGMSREHAQSVLRGIQGVYSKAQQEASSKKDVTAKAVDTAMRAAGMPGGEAEENRKKIENYLRSTGKQQLNPEGIKHDIEQLLRSPKAGAQALKARIGSIDKSTVATLLAQRKDMSQDEANKVVDQVDRTLRELTGKASGTTSSVLDSATGKMHDYLNSLNRPELRYEGIAGDLRTLFNDPKAGADALLERFKSMDRGTLKALLASRQDLSEQDAEHILNRMESVRDEFMGKATQMKDEVARRLEAAKDEALHQADETRKTAAVAAWWVFGIAVVSAVFAMVGGISGS